MLEIFEGLDEESLIQAVEETGWYPEGLPKDEDLREEMLQKYINRNLVYGGASELFPIYKNRKNGFWQVYLPDLYAPAFKELEEGFAHPFFTRSIPVEGRVHLPFTRYVRVKGTSFNFRVLKGGNVQLRYPFGQLEAQWKLHNNKPGTQFILESVLDGKGQSPINRLFTEKRGFGEVGLIPDVKNIVATYSHDNEFEPEAVIELALPDPELRSRLIQNFRDF